MAKVQKIPLGRKPGQNKIVLHNEVQVTQISMGKRQSNMPLQTTSGFRFLISSQTQIASARGVLEQLESGPWSWRESLNSVHIGGGQKDRSVVSDLEKHRTRSISKANQCSSLLNNGELLAQT